MPEAMPTEREHAKQVRTYDDTYLTCRDLRHTWRVVGFYREGSVVRRLLACERCGTQRLDRWRPATGEREQSRYNHPEQYRMRGGMDTYEVRKEVLSRAKIYASEAAMIAALTAGGTPQVRRGK